MHSYPALDWLNIYFVEDLYKTWRFGDVLHEEFWGVLYRAQGGLVMNWRSKVIFPVIWPLIHHARAREKKKHRGQGSL
jgi:hypothetical protein